MLELRDAAFSPVVFCVVGVHEDIRAGLYLVIDVTCGLEHIASRTRARHIFAFHPRFCKHAGCHAHVIDCPGNSLLTRGDTADVLRRTLICLQSGKPQVGGSRNLCRDGDGGAARLYAAAICPHIDFNQHVERHTGCSCCCIECAHVAGIISADSYMCTPV